MELLEHDKMEAREYAKLYNLKDYVIISIMTETGIGAYGAVEIAIQIEESKFHTVNGIYFASTSICHIRNKLRKALNDELKSTKFIKLRDISTFTVFE